MRENEREEAIKGQAVEDYLDARRQVLPGHRAAQRQAQFQERAFLLLLPSAICYPVRGKGLFVLIAGAMFFWVMGLLGQYSLLGALVKIAVFGYLCSYLFNVIGQTATGDDEPPDWPDLSRMYDDILCPIGRMVSALVVSLLPLIILAVLAIEQIYAGYWTFWVAAGAGLFYLPMALTSMAVHDSVGGLNPAVVLPAIGKTLCGYLVAVGALALSLVAGYYLEAFLAGLVPVLGSLLAGAASLYFLILQGRLLGLLYLNYRSRLDWVV